MESGRINISEVTDIKTLFHAGWCFEGTNTKHIILESTRAENNPLKLKAILAILTEGIMNSNTRKPFQSDFVYHDKEIHSLEELAYVLKEFTEINFTIEYI